AAYRLAQAEVDAETRPQTLHPRDNPVAGEHLVESAVEPLGYRVDVVVEARLTISRHRGDPRRHGHDMTVVSAAVLAVALRHQPIHDVLAAAEDAQRKAAADCLAQCTQVGRDA